MGNFFYRVCQFWMGLEDLQGPMQGSKCIDHFTTKKLCPKNMLNICMSKLVDMFLGQRIQPPDINLDIEPLHCLDVDDKPPRIMKLANAQHHAQ